MADELRRYRAMLPVRKHQLDDDLETHAEHQERISQEVTRANTRVLDAKETLAKTEARLAEQLRDSGEKMTIDAIAQRIKRDKSRIDAWEDWMRARDTYELWLGMIEAWRQKGFAMKTMADLYANQYFALNSAGSSARRADDSRYELRREAMHAKREEEENIPRRGRHEHT